MHKKKLDIKKLKINLYKLIVTDEYGRQLICKLFFRN